MRTKLGALLGAGGLLLLAASATIAAPPSFSISVSKTASVGTVPWSGGSVTFTVWVTNTGPDFLQTVNITEPLAGCTLGAKVETTGDGDAKLEVGETWTYSCTLTVFPETTNSVTVNACKDMSGCNNASHDAQGSASVTVHSDGTTQPPATQPPATEPPATEPPATEPPATEPPATQAPGTGAPGTPNPTQDQAGLTQAPTDTAGGVMKAIGTQRPLMLVLALGMLLASLILVTPSRPVRARSER